MRKRLLSILLALCMTSALLPTAFSASAVSCGDSRGQRRQISPACINDAPDKAAVPYNSAMPALPNAPVFTDVPPWCTVEANWAAAHGVALGVGSNRFAPDTTCTNAQILTFLWRAEGKPAAKAASPFTVASDYQGAVDWAYAKGMIGKSFSPDAPCTRANAVSFIWRTFGSKPPSSGGRRFSDVSSNASYAAAVAWAVENGITDGFPGNIFLPSKTCTRGQIVTFLYRAYVKSL